MGKSMEVDMENKRDAGVKRNGVHEAMKIFAMSVAAVFLFTVTVAPQFGAEPVYAADYEKWEDCDWDGYDDHTGVPVPWPGFDGTRGDTPGGASPNSQTGGEQSTDGSDSSSGSGSSEGGSSGEGSSDSASDKKNTEKKSDKNTDKKKATKKSADTKDADKKNAEKNVKKEDATEEKSEEDDSEKEAETTENDADEAKATGEDPVPEVTKVVGLKAYLASRAAIIAASQAAINTMQDSQDTSIGAIGTQDDRGNSGGGGGDGEPADSLLKALTAGFSTDNHELPAGIAVLASLLAAGLLALFVNAIVRRSRAIKE
jgi:hypothetical protein